ncbi:MAG: hypothetical protein [Circular genetic element sp.]|nr:MAG: hypothetical protein [Circular genetic element sp.]
MVRPGLFISPTQIEMLRISNEGMQAYDEGGLSGGVSYIAQDLGEKLATYGAVGSVLFFKGAPTQLYRLPAAFGGRLTGVKLFRTYGGYLSPFPSLGMIALGELYSHLSKSPGRAVADTSIGGSKREDSRVTISSRGAAAAAPQTLKPFWSNGKPKCRKGYRYDFKRKMCVKKS